VAVREPHGPRMFDEAKKKKTDTNKRAEFCRQKKKARAKCRASGVRGRVVGQNGHNKKKWVIVTWNAPSSRAHLSHIILFCTNAMQATNDGRMRPPSNPNAADMRRSRHGLILSPTRDFGNKPSRRPYFGWQTHTHPHAPPRHATRPTTRNEISWRCGRKHRVQTTQRRSLYDFVGHCWGGGGGGKGEGRGIFFLFGATQPGPRASHAVHVRRGRLAGNASSALARPTRTARMWRAPVPLIHLSPAG